MATASSETADSFHVESGNADAADILLAGEVLRIEGVGRGDPRRRIELEHALEWKHEYDGL